ncbi:MAG: DNA primase [Bacteroidales bacterium]|nr:DNA primase [Bacteroidales bacterium]
MIPQETVDQILDTARIEEVVGDFVTLKRRGANYVACCPFHNEKTPSFYVSPAKGIYKCFGCGKSGSAVGFVMEHEHAGYVEALRYLAARYHIEIVEEQQTAEEIERRQRHESLLLVSEFACKFFSESLKAGEGHSVGYQYFRSRGLEDATIEHFSLGWAPSGRTALLDAARAAGYKDEYLLAAGLCVQREDGTLADKFHERAMFPIHSVSGRVIAFSGRTLRSDNPAKYVNSPETEIYIKGRNLYGLYFAKSEIARQDKCILVEGNVDMVTLHQLGLTNVVASCGTSLTVEQVRLMRKFSENVTIMYDGDPAGIHAALRGIDLVLAEGLNVKIVLLPEGEDPDSYARKHTREEVESYIRDGERDFIEFKTDLLLSEAAGDPLKRATLINDIADTIAQIPDAVKRSVYVRSCARRFEIEESILQERVNRTRGKILSDARDEERRAELRRRRQESPEGPEPDSVPPEAPAPAEAFPIENRTLAPSEKELLQTLLQHGTSPLEFESDSPFRSEDGSSVTVADFIRDAVEGGGEHFANSVYRATYDAFMALYDADSQMSQDRIVRSLLDGADRTVADVSASLAADPYVLSIKSLIASMPTTASWLAIRLPEMVYAYQMRRIVDMENAVRRTLGQGNDDEQLPKLLRLQRIKKQLQEKYKKLRNDR